MIECLYQIAKIESGKSFRHRIENDPQGECLVIQMKDISSDLLSVFGQPNAISINEVNHHQLLQKGDILFMAKGNNNYAIEYTSDSPAVAVSLFFVIKPNPTIINSSYLTWYLNSSKVQSYFTENREGSSVGNIRKEVLERLEIELPSFEKQFQIAQLSKLLQEEKSLTKELVRKKEQFIMQTMLNLIQ